MAFKMNRRIKIVKGVTLNVSKSGISTSAKVGRVTVNSRRGATVNVAKGVSYNVGGGSKARRGKAAAPVARRAVTAVPAGPRTFRRPFGKVAGWVFWTGGIVAAVLLGAIPVVGPFLLLAVVAGLVAVWLMTPKQMVRDPSAPATVATVAESAPIEPNEGL